MATHTVLKAIVWILASPLVMLSRMMIRFRLFSLNIDLQRCLDVVDAAPSLPDRFVITLVAAEDHRSSTHPGIDPIAMLRVLSVFVRTWRFQGASTIEQQLVRVVLDRYERTLQRKFHEQMLAIALSGKRSKARIAMAYLSIAFYGSGQYGLAALTRACGRDLKTATQHSIAYMVARLKYPEPLSPSTGWHRRIHIRAQYIFSRLPELDNNFIKQPPQTAD